MAPPPALMNWFRSAYPTLRVNPEWIEGCVDYLESIAPGLSGQALVKQVEAQLLASDLSSSSLPVAHDTTSAIVFRTRTLLQLTALDLVSHPALALYETLKDKREARKAGVDPAAAKKEDDAEEEEGRTRGAGEDGPEEDKVGVWPKKGLGRLEVSDGHLAWVAMEYRPLGEWCSLDKITMGAKIVVHNVRQVNGVLLLERSCVTFKGGDVQEFEQYSEWTLENQLRARLKKEAVPLPGTEPEPERKPAPPAATGTDCKPPVASSSRAGPPAVISISSGEDDEIDFGPDEDFDEAAMAEVEALEQQAISARTANLAPVSSTSVIKSSSIVGSIKLSPPGKKVLAMPLPVSGSRAASQARSTSSGARTSQIEVISLDESSEEERKPAAKKRKGAQAQGQVLELD